MKEDLFAAARRASGFTCEDAARICGVSRVTYSQRELNPKDFRLSELRSLYAALSDASKPLLSDAIGFFICGSDYIKRNT